MDFHDCPLSTFYLYSVLLLWHPMSWPDWAAGSADSTYLVGFPQATRYGCDGAHGGVRGLAWLCACPRPWTRANPINS